MTDFARIGRDHVLHAVSELSSEVPPDGSEEGPAYRLVRDGQEHDAVSVVDRAHLRAVGHPLLDDWDDEPPLTPRDCALLLRGLGFEVAGSELPPLRFTNAATVGTEHAHATWSLAARERLLEVAATYGDSIDYHDLADFVQHRSLIRTTAHPRTWIGDVLGRVALDCKARHEPLLTSLVVDAHGKVGASYATALGALRGSEPADVDAQAAEERWDCHRRFGADLPADGGGPVVLTPRPRQRTTATQRPRASAGPGTPGARPSPGVRTRGTTAGPPREPKVKRSKVTGGRRTAEESVAAAAPAAGTCPVHYTVIPPSGVCDYCE